MACFSLKKKYSLHYSLDFVLLIADRNGFLKYLNIFSYCHCLSSSN